MDPPRRRVATVGITEHAQSQLGDIVYVELPEIGRKVEKGGEAAVVESVKAASDVYAPASGEVVAVNDALGSRAGRDQRGGRGQGLVLPAEAHRARRARRADERRAVQGIPRHAGMTAMAHEYRATVTWKRDGGATFTDQRYSRGHTLELRRRHHGAGLVLAAQRQAALFGRRGGRSRGGVRRGAVELPHADVPLRGGEAGLRRSTPTRTRRSA